LAAESDQEPETSVMSAFSEQPLLAVDFWLGSRKEITFTPGRAVCGLRGVFSRESVNLIYLRASTPARKRTIEAGAGPAEFSGKRNHNERRTA
jgi:hypothetical protein